MKELKVDYRRRTIVSGHPGENKCRDVPNGGTDGNGTVFITYAMSYLDKDDSFAESYIQKSTDGGETFSEPKALTVPTHHPNGVRFSFRDTVMYYCKKYDKWMSFGCVMDYDENNNNIRKNGIIIADPVYSFLDPEKCDYDGDVKPLPFPYDYISVFAQAQPIEYENGEILLSFYYITEECHRASVVSVRYSFDGESFTIVKAGTPIDGSDYNRGFVEPSIARLGEKYYMTIRSDERGLFAVSDDGLNFSEVKPWRFDDGSLIGNYNTMQHWARFKDALYLVYNRKGTHNDHIARHRAPVFMARFDEEKECLIKDSEVVLVPELGAQLGNFVVLDINGSEAMLVDIECMQSGRVCDDIWEDCARYGSNNSVWVVNIYTDEV